MSEPMYQPSHLRCWDCRDGYDVMPERKVIELIVYSKLDNIETYELECGHVTNR